MGNSDRPAQPATRRRQNPADADRQYENPDGLPRPCDECGKALPAGHGNRRYHQDCAKDARARKSRAYSAAYRRTQRDQKPSQPVVPNDYLSPNISVPGAVLPGHRVLELRAALWPVMLHVMQNHLYLKQFRPKHMNPDRLRLRGLIDDTRLLLDLLNEYLPEVLPESVYRDPELVRKAVDAGKDPAEYEPPAVTAPKMLRIKPPTT